MSQKVIFALLACILVLGGAGCEKTENIPAMENQNENENINGNANEEAVEAGSETITSGESAESEKIGNVSFISYVNKSVKYTIERPDRWYWRHYIERELAVTHPGIMDYFITDKNPLPRLESEYLGRMVIEVSGKSLEELAGNVSDLASSDATVGGIEARKYEGTRNNEAVQDQRIISYHFQKDGKTFRIVYTKNNSTPEEEAIFEHLVSSFKFAE
jgi:hypothetical protein